MELGLPMKMFRHSKSVPKIKPSYFEIPQVSKPLLQTMTSIKKGKSQSKGKPPLPKQSSLAVTTA